MRGPVVFSLVKMVVALPLFVCMALMPVGLFYLIGWYCSDGNALGNDEPKWLTRYALWACDQWGIKWR